MTVKSHAHYGMAWTQQVLNVKHQQGTLRAIIFLTVIQKLFYGAMHNASQL